MFSGWRARAQTGLLGHRDFRLLWGGETVSQFGSAVTRLALPIIAAITLHASAFQVGSLIAASEAGFVLVGLPAGAIVDRMRRRPVLIASDIARVVALASIPIAFAFGALTIGQLYAVALFTGIVTVFFDVAYQSYLPSLVGREHLIEGNTKLATTQSVAEVAGPGLAGLLVQALGGAYAIVTDAASFVVSAVAIATIRTSEPAPEPPEGGHRRLRVDIAEGLRFVFGNSFLRSIAGCSVTYNFFETMGIAVSVVFLVRTVHLGAGIIGLLFAIAGAGGALGAVLSDPIARRVGVAKAIIAGVSASCVGNLLLPLTVRGPGLLFWAVGVFSANVGSMIYNVTQLSLRQTLCPDRLLGRMNSTIRFMIWGVLPLGGLAGAALGQALGLRATLWVAGAGGVLTLPWVVFSPLRRVDDIPPENEGTAAPAR